MSSTAITAARGIRANGTQVTVERDSSVYDESADAFIPLVDFIDELVDTATTAAINAAVIATSDANAATLASTIQTALCVTATNSATTQTALAVTATSDANNATSASTSQTALCLTATTNANNAAIAANAAAVAAAGFTNASNITSGNLAYARLPTGNGSWDTGAGTTITITRALTVSGALTGTLTGNADTATRLATPRAINGVNFDGSAAVTVTAAAGTLTGATLAANVLASSLTSVGTLATLTVTATITGSVSGNAGTATALQTGRAINGVTFDGTGAITVTAAAGTLTGTTLNATVVTSSLTSVGTLASLAVTGTLSAGGDFAINTNKFTVTASSGNTLIAGAATLSSTLAVTSTTTLTGSVGVGGAPFGSTGVRIVSAALAGVSQYGTRVEPVYTSGSTTSARGVQIVNNTAAASFTVAEATGLYVANTVLGATSAVTLQRGIFIETQTVGTTNWAIYCQSSSSSGGVTFRDSALATNATVGHLFIPSCAGTPTGVPATIPSGQVAFQYDSTNNIIYAYNGAWKKTVALT